MIAKLSSEQMLDEEESKGTFSTSFFGSPEEARDWLLKAVPKQ
jgi:hypothetical protein